MSFTETKARIFQRLKNANVTEVAADFSGSGDSGCIDEVIFMFDRVTESTLDALSQKFDQTVCIGKRWNPQHDIDPTQPQFIEEYDTRTMTLSENVEDFMYDVIAKDHAGWEINEGSSGTVEFDVESDQVTLNIAVYRTESDDYTEEY